MTVLLEAVRTDWKCQRFTSPFTGLFGSVVEADDDVLGVAWDVDPARADVRALGEAVERAALQEPPSSALVTASAAELGDTAIRLDDRVTYSPAQCAAHPELAPFAWDEQMVGSWLPMSSATGELLVPADLERMRIGRGDLRRPKPMTSIGTACGTDPEVTRGRALTEVVERNAIACASYAGRPAVRVRPDDPRYSVGDVADLFGGAAELVVGLVPGDHFGMQVAIVAVAGARDGLPEAAFGSAAAFDAADAIRSAAIEAVHIFHLAWRLQRRGSDPEAEPTSINSRALWWARQGRRHLETYFQDGTVDDGSTSVAPDEVASRIDAELTRAGHAWACSEITPAWAGGLVVVRAVVPSLLYLQINEHPFTVAPRWASDVDAYVERVRAGTAVHHPFV